MRKTGDISKLDTGWQVLRVSLKELAFQDKLTTVGQYLRKNATRATKERVLNYLEGLSFGYPAESANRKECLELFSKLKELVVTAENNCSEDFSEFNDKALKKLLQDLTTRTIKWLKKGYRQEELIVYVQKLAVYLQDTATLDKVNRYKQASYSLCNTHKFFF